VTAELVLPKRGCSGSEYLMQVNISVLCAEWCNHLHWLQNVSTLPGDNLQDMGFWSPLLITFFNVCNFVCSHAVLWQNCCSYARNTF